MKNAAMINFQELLVLYTVASAAWAIKDKHPGEGLDTARYPVNITGMSRIYEGKSKSSITERSSDECLREGQPTESCNKAGGFCIDKHADCPGATNGRGCNTKGCKCCMPHLLSDCRPRRSCSSADGFCVMDEADCQGVIDQFGCKGAECKCCLHSGYDLPWVYLGDDAFVPFFNNTMNWYDAQSLCRSHGLNLYRPHDIINVIKYLDENKYGDANRYWLGAKGDGNNQIWFNGDGMSYADPWYAPRSFYNNGTNDCLLAIGSWWEDGAFLVATVDSCIGYSTSTNPLCG